MKTPLTSTAAKVCLLIAVLFSFSALTHAGPAPNWEAYNDYSAGPLTSPNASGIKLRITGDTGVLRDYATGLDLPVSVLVENDGGAPDDFGARGGAPNAGSPSIMLFGDKVDLANEGLPGVHADINLRLVFSGLDPGKVYKFCGTVSRGGSYNNRWSVYSITGAGNFVAAHLDGSLNQNIITAASYAPAQPDLMPNQVALNSGHNKEGSVICWDKIEPAGDGTFKVDALRYLGPTPFGDAPNAGTSYAYGFEAIYLAEYEPTAGVRISENPASQKVAAGRTATLRVAATSVDPFDTVTYQWQMQAPAAPAFANIAGATSATYTTPPLTVADDQTKYRAVCSVPSASVPSEEATVTVDGVIPTVTGATSGVNLNSVYVTFSEPMNLGTMANPANYEVSGSLTVMAAVALDPFTARVITSTQSPGVQYTLKVHGVEDVAGNPVAANTSLNFLSYGRVSGTVGVDIWKNIGGSAVTDLTGNARYPADFDIDFATTTFDSQLVVPAVPDLNTYAGRMRAWLTPDVAGDYEFFLSADDQAELRLSDQADFANIDSVDLIPIAIDTVGENPATFHDPGDASTSVAIPLEAGRSYPLQAIWKEGNGADHCKVGWRLVGDPTPVTELPAIPSKFLSYYGPVPSNAPRIKSIALQSGQIVIDWTGSALESSPDLKTWGEIAGAAKPYMVAPTGTGKFFRSKN